MASAEPSRVIKLVILDREPSPGEQITINGETGTYIDGSAVPIDSIPNKSDFDVSKMTDKQTYLVKNIGADGTINIEYFEPGASSGSGPTWKPIPDKGFIKEHVSVIPRAANYKKTRKQSKGILSKKLSPDKMVSAAINETPFSLAHADNTKQYIQNYNELAGGIPHFRKPGYIIEPIQLNATNKNTIENTEKNSRVSGSNETKSMKQKANNSTAELKSMVAKPKKTTQLRWNESVSKCTDYGSNQKACEADKQCEFKTRLLKSRKISGCVTKPTNMKNIKFFDKETREFIDSDNVN